MSDWTHTDLQMDLLATRRENGEVAVQELSCASWGSNGWVDVATVKPSWSNPNPTGYEVKVSRSDFMSDVRSGKYRRYLPFFRRFYFACPAGMVKKKEVPEGMGLIVRSDKGWSGVVGPSVTEIDDGDWPQLLLAMLMRQKEAPWRAQTNDDPEARRRRVRKYRDHLEASRIIDHSVKKQIREARRNNRQMKRAREKLCEVLGVEPDGQRLTSLAEKLIRREAGDDHTKKLVEKVADRTVDRLRRGLERKVEDLQDLQDQLEEIAEGGPA